MSSFVNRLRTEIDMRARDLDIGSGSNFPMTNRGQTIDSKFLPMAFVWIESDSVDQRTKPDDDSGRGTEYHTVAFQAGVIVKNDAALGQMDAFIAELRSRMATSFEGHEIRLIGTDYEDEIRTFGRPYVAATLNFTIEFTTLEGDGG